MYLPSIIVALAIGLPVSVRANPHLEAIIMGGYRARDANLTCTQIAQVLSASSSVGWPGSDQYVKDISHWAGSSTDASACSVEPGTAEDIGKILRIVGADNTPFAVKGGGHASNPGFSSTPGVQIAMSRFSEVIYDANTQTVDVGSGLVWDDVYAALEPHGVNVVGGRVSGVGVAGLTLGGGYSWLTNERGLTVDNIVGYELVLPDGTVTQVTQPSNPDLFFGLKGGVNNFGIVTKFTFKAYPQGQVWGGFLAIAAEHLDQVNAATVKFASNVTDPKAAVLPSYNYVLQVGATVATIILFYNGPNPPAGIFDDYLAIPTETRDISTRSFLSLVQSPPVGGTAAGARAVFHTVPTARYTSNTIAAIVNETKFWGERLSSASGTFFSFDVEPFLPTILSHADSSSSAYPPSRARTFQPTDIYFAWGDQNSDDLMHESIRESARQLNNVALSEGQDITNAPLYGNYAIFNTPLEQIFGEHLPKLRRIKAKYDPRNVMGLTGGWKF